MKIVRGKYPGIIAQGHGLTEEDRDKLLNASAFDKLLNASALMEQGEALPTELEQNDLLSIPPYEPIGPLQLFLIVCSFAIPAFALGYFIGAS